MKVENSLYRIFIFWYICGLLLLGFDVLPSWLEWANTVFLMLSGTLGGIYFLKSFSKRNALWIIAIIFVSTLFMEYLGSAYDVLFGKYEYTKKFGISLFGVPLGIGFAWLMVMATSHVVAKRIIPQRGWLRMTVGGLLAVIIDLIIDPVAYHVKQYWIWEEYESFYYNIPISNFVGWFVIAFTLHGLLSLFAKIESERKSSPLWEKRMLVLYFLMIGMFLLLGIIEKLWLAVFLTTVLTAVVYMLIGRKELV